EAGGEAKSLPFIEINTKRLNGSFIQANSWLIDLPAKVPQEFLMVVKPEVQSSSTVRVQTLDRYVESEQLMGNIVGFLTGWLLATSLYFAYSFIRYKQQMTLYASLYAVCSAAFVVQLLGYSIIYWDLSANQSILLLRLTILTSLILFMGFVFHAPWSNSRDMDKTKTRLRWFGAIAIVASVFSLTFSPTNAAGIHTQLIISITGITLFILLIQAKTSVPNARLWIFYGVIITAIAPIFSALASSSMMGSNLIPTPWLTLLAPVTVVASMVMTLISIKKNQSKDQGAHGKGVSISPSVLSQISHQLRSPINGIQGMNELLNDTPLTNDQKTFSATIRRSSREVLHVADEISLLAKSTENSPYLTQKNLNLGQLLDTLVEHFQSDAASKDVELIVDRHEFQQQQLLVDGNRTPTLLHNLMAYVLGYIEQGEVALHLTAVSARKGEPGTACIQFQLIGEVSNREQFRHILQNLNKPVYPNNPNTTWSNLVSSNLMQALRAVLEIESLNSTGGSLTLYLPVVPQAFTATTQNVSDDSLLGLSALIVDDNASLRDVVEKQVMRWGVQPHATHSGKDALAIMRNQCALQQPFDVAIIDQQMPIMDGLELARRIRE
ncbi:MAG: histidine kinase dimerization/phospho-acceptor domain-containing protein, partial [Oceanobacter sp.]